MKNKTFRKAIFYLIFFQIFSFMVGKLMESRFFQIFEIQHQLTSDFTYVDLYYRYHNNDDPNDNVRRKHKENIFLINTESLDGEEFRGKLSLLIHRLQKFYPKAVGIDLTFNNIPRQDQVQATELISSLKKYDNIVCAQNISKEDLLGQTKGVARGSVDFPDEQHSIRFYKGGTKTFAYQLFKKSRKQNDELPIEEIERFPIAYSTMSSGIVDFWESSEDVYWKDKPKNFRVLDANQILQLNESEEKYISEILAGSILIVGQVSFDPNNIEDKHPSPTDTNNMINRDRIMPGAVIHANALSNMLDNHFFQEPNFWLLEIILNMIMFTMIMLVLRHTLKIILIGGLLVLSVFWIWLSIYLLEFDIYIQVGTTLIELMILEEFIETFDPLINRIWNKIKSKVTNPQKT